MYTVKRIIEGDEHGTYTEDWLFSRQGGKTFKEAIALANNPTILALTPTESELEKAKHITPVDGSDINVAHYIVGVTVIRGGQDNGEDLVLTGANTGTWTLDQALAVLVTNKVNSDGEMEVSYDFIYPNEELYITDRFGNTVRAFR